MAENPSAPDVKRFEHEEHDVSCCCEVLFCGSSLLILGEEEAELIKNSCCGTCTTKKRGPYGELGTVDIENCFCCYGFGAASLMSTGADGAGGAQFTGCGCEKAKVEDLVSKLKLRQEMRGDRAKVRMAEATMESLKDLHSKMDLVMEKLGVSVPPTAEKMDDREETTMEA